MPVSMLVSVTLATGTMAPVESLTEPRTEPWVDWALAVIAVKVRANKSVIALKKWESKRRLREAGLKQVGKLAKGLCIKMFLPLCGLHLR